MFRFKSLVLPSVALVGLLTLGASTARADNFSFRIGFGLPARPVAIAPAGGHWEERTVQVLLSPGRYETRYCPPATTRYVDAYGRTVTVTTPGRYDNVWVEPVYTTSCQQVWVPDPVYIAPRPTLSFGFGFSDRDRGHDHHRHGSGHGHHSGHRR